MQHSCSWDMLRSFSNLHTISSSKFSGSRSTTFKDFQPKQVWHHSNVHWVTARESVILSMRDMLGNGKAFNRHEMFARDFLHRLQWANWNLESRSIKRERKRQGWRIKTLCRVPSPLQFKSKLLKCCNRFFLRFFVSLLASLRFGRLQILMPLPGRPLRALGGLRLGATVTWKVERNGEKKKEK